MSLAEAAREAQSTQDWTIEEDSTGWIARLGDAVARGDSRERARISLIEKLALYQARLASLARSPIAPLQQSARSAAGSISL